MLTWMDDVALFWPDLWLANTPIIMEKREDMYWETTSRLHYGCGIYNHLK